MITTMDRTAGRLRSTNLGMAGHCISDDSGRLIAVAQTADSAERIVTACNAFETMREAFSELLNATIEDCGDGSKFPDDDGGVALDGDGKESAVTFAIIRRSIAALSTLPVNDRQNSLSCASKEARAALKGLTQPAKPTGIEMTEAQIKHMVDRFLSWKLPESFNPDGGISFTKNFNEHTPYPSKHEPYGTNLFNFDEATAMVHHMLEGLTATEARKLSSAANDVLAERDRQKAVEGWTHLHDDTHDCCELASAAACYCLGATTVSRGFSDSVGGSVTATINLWPVSWPLDWWKPKRERRNLVRAGALILAEIERLDRAEAGKISTDEVL